MIGQSQALFVQNKRGRVHLQETLLHPAQQLNHLQWVTLPEPTVTVDHLSQFP